MHIAFFNRSYYPDTTATGQLLTDLCEDLVAVHGCRVSVVAGVPLLPAEGRVPSSRALVSREEHAGVRILRARGTRFPKARFIGRATNYVTYFLSACYAGLRLDRPDVVVALTDPPIIGLAAWLTGKRHRAPLVMAFKDLFPEVTVLLQDFHSDTVNAMLQRVNEFLVRRAAVNVALGETMRQRLLENKGAPPDRTVIIADWADTTAIAPAPKRNAFSEAHGLADRFVVMHSGNLGLSQSLETVVDAAALLSDLPDLDVVFVGEGVKKPELQAQVTRLGLTNVRFLPFTPREGLRESFATADLFIVSLQRGLAGYIVPSKLYGILAAGRPYVAAVEADCEVAALTTRHGCGRLAEPGDAASMAAAIRACYDDRAETSRQGARAREASVMFDRRRQVARYFELFGAVTAPTSAGSPVPASRRV
ncbi:MAG TPA: glycosyltransferase family 4 protein [Vicinamibacterales bacterium]|nr:glycosyltransferase family 4 protein [Vicinamibacterales bacterium]